MNKKYRIPEIIRTAINNDSMHVFFVNSPICAIVSRLIIEKYKLKSNNILIIPIRKTDLSLLDISVYKPNIYWSDKFLEKLFNLNVIGKRIESKLNNFNKKFLIYTAWFYKEVKNAINSKNCLGHIYIEEGQLSYRNIKPFSLNDEKNNFSIISRPFIEPDFRTNYFLDSADAYIGLFPEVFPVSPRTKLFVLDNLDLIKSFYKPKLFGIKTIGLTCAERRLKSKDWKNMIIKLVKKMPDGGVIKLHPSFNFNSNRFNLIESFVKSISKDKVKVCNQKIIIEIEMMYESKHIIGPLTSLKKYTLLLGSKFEDIKLY